MMNDNQILRLRATIHGAVQGVGFRPFIYKLATSFGLKGWVKNSSQGVHIEAEGLCRVLKDFLLRIEPEKPPRSFIQSLESSFLDPVGYEDFNIRPSDVGGEKTALILPDIATCTDCLKEVMDSTNRRYRYPFTNCTNCGPRFTIVESMPYDRPGTTMKAFTLCPLCQEEYHNPLDRRFHAQPNACPECGPHLELWDRKGAQLALRDLALSSAAEYIRQGAIVAVKGVGGFHLFVDARNDKTVRTLRERKQRNGKALAVMFPSLDSLKALCEVSSLEERLLLSPESPIVILKRNGSKSFLSDAIAPRNPYLGALLPYTPLHYLLMKELGFPIVATSGNLAEETLCTDEAEALLRLGNIADIFLIHNRSIARHMDDSIVRIVMGREMVVRRARGYAPLPVYLQYPVPPLLAVGGHIKNTIAVTAANQVFMSQHIGDLGTTQAYDSFTKTIESFTRLYGIVDEENRPIIHDSHPDYVSTYFADDCKNCNSYLVQHHYAHILSCMAENDILDNSVLGVAWDGSGYGEDDTLWGGEFLHITDADYKRIAHFRTFYLPGGEKAVKEPRRTAIGLLYEAFGDEAFEMDQLSSLRAFTKSELSILRTALKQKINTPITSSVGRLFDAVASIVGLCQQSTFEGQAAMELEFALMDFQTECMYSFELEEKNDLIVVNWAPMLREILADTQSFVPVGNISAKFHNTLAAIIVDVAIHTSEEKVVLSGGCFQNKYLTERVVSVLTSSKKNKFRSYWHQRIPPNDGGIALGQAIAFSFMQRKKL